MVLLGGLYDGGFPGRARWRRGRWADPRNYEPPAPRDHRANYRTPQGDNPRRRAAEGASPRGYGSSAGGTRGHAA
ncbi:hypothetical protein GCM10010400_06100 [Streptomyces aculeolatus]